MMEENLPLEGRVCLVTGGTSGIGKQTVKQLARLGAEVIFTARDIEKGKKIKKEIILSSRNPDVYVVECDLGNYKSIVKCVKAINEDYDKIDVLINNAGVWNTKFELTSEGVESHFGINHLGHFLLTNLLLPIIKKGKSPRIINLSSGIHYRAKLNINDLEGREIKFSSFMAYANSKLCNLLFTNKLARIVEQDNITVNAVHPGVVKTALFNDMNPLIKFLLKFVYISPGEGAKTTVYLASSPKVAGLTGKYFTKCAEKKPALAALNTNLADELWTKSMEYVVGFIK
jgi:NAD(P)-dependent dehydrogenase (short-subunit alcohol dehydrogenase family)